jgi:molybdenum cofactor sulfurtransferase
MNVRYNQFVKQYATFETTTALDDLRRRDYSRLDKFGQIYLDYTGGSLYAESQVKVHQP